MTELTDRDRELVALQAKANADEIESRSKDARLESGKSAINDLTRGTVNENKQRQQTRAMGVINRIRHGQRPPVVGAHDDTHEPPAINPARKALDELAALKKESAL